MAEIIPESSASPSEGNPWDIQFLGDLHGPTKVKEFLKPPSAKPQTTTPEEAQPFQSSDWMRRMFAALLDPRSIQWLLTLGGGLMVLGGLIWLISSGAFENPHVAAVILGALSLGVLGLGWFVVLKTRYRIAGRALTFLGCIFISLNLWFYHAQGLLLLDEGLWVACVACVLLYIATVWTLRDPLFLYAVEAGVTLTVLLLLGDLGLAGHATYLSVLLMVLALTSIHAHKTFPSDAETFSERRFGMPLFWSGHVQLAAALVVLLGTQIAGSLTAFASLFNLPPEGILLTSSRWAPALLWLAAAYAYLYSDLAVRRVGVYMYLAAGSLVMAEITLIRFDLFGIEGLIVTLAITATTISVASLSIPASEDRLARAVAPLALVLSIVPVALGLMLHVGSTSIIADGLEIQRETTWLFVGVMLLVAVANRVSAWLYQQRSPGLAAVYLFFSAGSLVVAAAGFLRMLGQESLFAQTAWLMWIPIGYLVASRLWRGKSPERPLAWIAHTTTVILLAHVARGAAMMLFTGFEPASHLRFGFVLAEAALFYNLARVIQGRVMNSYLAVGMACAAVWQFMLYLALPHELFTVVFAVVGLALMVTARALGLEDLQIYDASGAPRTVIGGRGAAALHSSGAVLLIAILIAFLRGLERLAAFGLENSNLTGLDWLTLVLMTAAAIAAAVLSPRSTWRRTYTVGALAMTGLSLLTITVAVDLSMGRKLEILLVAVGLAMLGAGYIGRFLEDEKPGLYEMVPLGLWLGSLLAALPLLVAVFIHWGTTHEFSVYDELALIAVTLLMVATGVVWRVKASTLLGGGTLFIYLCSLIISMLHRPQIAIGIYLAAGGFLLFALGLTLAMCRDHLAALPERIAKREGVFRVLTWR